MVVGYTDIWGSPTWKAKGGLVSGTPTSWSIARLNSTFVAEPLCCGSMAAKISAFARHNLLFGVLFISKKSLHKMHKGKESEMPPKFSCSVRDFSVLDSYTLQSYRFLDLIGGVFWGQVRKPRLTKSGHGFLVGICFTTASPHIHFLTSHRNKCLGARSLEEHLHDPECDISRDMQMVCNVERGSWLFPHL